ncbi:MAG TPA: Ig-like domain-containing protein [Patescibacteria group bacterium]|nr:Ig-like domain-containing protein [Patescibacteria group bacterium]
MSYVTSNSSAVAPGDYATTSGTVTFVPGTTMQSLTVGVVGDEAVESNESFLVTLKSVTNATIGDSQASGTIFDDDAGRQVVIDDTRVLEGDGGTTNAVFTLTLSRAALAPVTVSYVTSNSSAVAPGDYATTSGTVTFVPGTTTQSLTVGVVGDEAAESNESFLVTLKSITNATIGDSQASGTIFDDDAGRQVVIDDARMVEGDSGTTSLVFTLTLSKAALTPVTVNFVTSNSSAVAPGDYATTSGTLIFVPGTTTRTIPVAVIGDEWLEGNENFFISLTNGTHATIGDSTALGTIFNDDVRPFVLSASLTTLSETSYAPVAQDDAYTLAEDTTLIVPAAQGLLANDTSPHGDALSAVTVPAPQPAHGTLTLNANGSFTYRPDANFNGTDSFLYRATDGRLSADAVVALTIRRVNDPPVARDDAYTLAEDTTLVVPAVQGVLANDTDTDADALSAVKPSTVVAEPAHGTLTLNANGSFTYRPAANFNGTDSFVYTTTDGRLGDDAVVTLTIGPVNDAPLAADDWPVTEEDTPVVIDVRGEVLANDTDVDGDRLVVSGFTQGAHGTVSANADGTLTYTPAANFNGRDEFRYEVSDGQGGTASATIVVTVAPVNDAPLAADDWPVTEEDTPVVIDVRGELLADDTDVDGDRLVVSGFTQSAHGTVSANADGTLTYTPDLNFNGPDAFKYEVSDGRLTASATVTITMKPVNDAPVLDPIRDVTVTEGVPLVLTATGSDVDAPSRGLAFSLVGPTPEGARIDAADGILRWTPTEAQGPALYRLTVRVDDGALDATQTFGITVLEDTTIDTGPGAADRVPDTLRIVRSAADILVSLNGTVIFTGALEVTRNLSVNGSTDDDTLVVDLGGGNPIPAGGIVYNGGGPGDNDTLTLVNGAAASIEYAFIDSSSGSVTVDGFVISYTGLEPIFDTVTAANRTFVFGPGPDAIGVAVGATQSVISSQGSSETVTLANPTVSLVVDAGAGNDTVTVTATALQTAAFEVTVDGGPGVNSVQGTVVTSATAVGTEGADVIDVSETSTGGILITVNGATSTFAAGTHVRVDALGGDDRVTLRNRKTDASVDGGAGNDVIDGSRVTTGKLTLLGGAGNDMLIGGGGDDRLEGGSGNDTLEGGPGKDTVLGGDGDDRLTGGIGDDSIAGGDGADVVTWSRGDGSDAIDGGTGADAVLMYGSASADDVAIRASDTHVNVSIGGARLDLQGIERLAIDSGAGADTIRIGDLRGTVLAFIEVDAGAGNDVVDASATNATLTLRGGAGDDTLLGGSGNDRIEGGAGRETIHGGDGNDTIMGDGGDDLLFGDAGNDVLSGGDGDDIIIGGAGNDVASGGAGDDLIHGGDGNDTLMGDAGDDVLFGGAGDDVLSGGTGKNVLIGGPGNDALIAGSRKDILMDDGVLGSWRGGSRRDGH